MNITKMTIDNYDEVLALWQSCGDEGVCIDEDVDSRLAIEAYLKRNPGMSFVAREKNQLIGAVLCGTDGRRGYLNHLAVDKAHRGKGIGKKLVERSLAGLEKSGIRKCHIFVLNTNNCRPGVLVASGMGAARQLRSDVASATNRLLLLREKHEAISGRIRSDVVQRI